MPEIAIRAEKLGKKFSIGSVQPRYKTLRESLVNMALGPVRATRRILRDGFKRSENEEVWALKDISFEIRPGEVVGVIGRNGAGKSTLLKILSRITDPSVGYAEVYGRIGSLLEVGTGFHPELSGRENVYLNAAILGMKRRDIEKRFEEMVEFAEIAKFIDTPVKFYSSGMYLRLAFSVAAHLEPDILLVDEILAVGDAAFQNKCLGKMGDVAKQGRTVLFVSHNMGQIRRLCETGFWINQGSLVKNGPVAEVVGAYQQDQTRGTERAIQSLDLESKVAGFLSWQIIGSAPSESNRHILQKDGPFELEILLRIPRRISKAHYKLILISPEGQRIGGWCLPAVSLEKGLHRIVHQFAALPVHPGVYNWYAALWEASARIDEVYFAPDLVVGTPDHSGLTEEWAGIVNTPCNIMVR